MKILLLDHMNQDFLARASTLPSNPLNIKLPSLYQKAHKQLAQNFTKTPILILINSLTKLLNAWIFKGEKNPILFHLISRNQTNKKQNDVRVRERP